MGKNLEPQFAFRCDKKTMEKLGYIAKAHTRTRNQEMKYVIKEYIMSYEQEHGEIAVAEEPTRKEALDAQKQTIKERHNQPVGKTLIESLKNGFDYGNASK